MTVGIKYCGGCNPRYDRVAFAAALAAACPEVSWVPAWPGESYDRLAVLCGCSARCADYGAVTARCGTLVVDHMTALEEAAGFFRRAAPRPLRATET